jgi:hypothetical protein
MSKLVSELRTLLSESTKDDEKALKLYTKTGTIPKGYELTNFGLVPKGAKSASSIGPKSQSKPQKVSAGDKDAITTYVKTGKVPKGYGSKSESTDEVVSGLPDLFVMQKNITQYIALMAQSLGLDGTNPDHFQVFYKELMEVVKNKSKLKTVMKSWNTGKASKTFKTIKTSF